MTIRPATSMIPIYNPNAYVPGQNRRNGVARAIVKAGTTMIPYTSRAYAPGQGRVNSPVPAAIQAKGFSTASAAAKAAAGGGGGGGGGGGKVPKTWQEQLMALYTSLYGHMQTPEQQAATIQKGINAQIAAQTAANKATLAETLAANREVTRAQQVQLANQQARAMGFSRAIGSLQAGEGERVYDDYERAAQNIQGLGTGLSGAVLDSQQSAADAAASAVERASGGINTAGTSYDLPGLRTTAQYLGTTAPARDLFTEAANQAGNARLRNVTSAQTLRNLAADYGQKGVEAQGVLAGEQRKAQTAYAGTQRTLQATRPDLYAKAVEAARSGYRQDAATAVSALTLANTSMATTADIANAKAQTRIDELELANTTALAKIKAQSDTIKAISTANKNDADTADTIGKASGYQADGKTLRPGYWLPAGKGTVPQPYDTSKYHIKPGTGSTVIEKNPDPPKTGSGGGNGAKSGPKINGQTMDQVLSTIDTRTGDLTKAVMTAPYAEVTNPYAVSKGRENPTYAPLRSYKAALALALQSYPKAYLLNADIKKQITAKINTALASVGYKVK